jgi:HEAT repeat protein
LQAISAISGDPDVGIPEGVALLECDDPEVRRACLDAIRESGACADVLKEKVCDSLQDPVSAVRRSAVLTLARVEPDAMKAMPHLLSLLSDDDLDVRAHGAMALARYGPEASEALEPLEALMEVDAPHLQAVAVAALARIRGEGAPG